MLKKQNIVGGVNGLSLKGASNKYFCCYDEELRTIVIFSKPQRALHRWDTIDNFYFQDGCFKITSEQNFKLFAAILRSSMLTSEL